MGRKSIDLSGDWLKDDDPDNLNAPGLPRYTADYNACRLVEEEIKRRNLQNTHIRELSRLAGMADRFVTTTSGNYQAFEFLASEVWLVWGATADQRCHAALKALGIEI